MTTHFTEPQLRALSLLPKDGSRLLNAGRNSPALDSLALYFPGLCQADWGDFGLRGGRKRAWSLTPAGIEAAKIEEAKRHDQ